MSVDALRKRLTLTVEEVAELTGLPKSNLYQLAQSGEIKSAKLGKRIVLQTDSLLRMLGFDD